jgi:hypothetical protein
VHDFRAKQRTLKNLTVWKRGGERAPHKPLLAIYAFVYVKIKRIQPVRSRIEEIELTGAT